ncbi:hypothetical protein [Deinococcus arenicola]|uniref:Tetratricopeptide repeat protein n=1 Tax=Deinococcus arenicola TaxID=2994950 RepID=A0ABU4DX71_9DEIO|nr:hypothetical protein [Deinococcus sp. ZS9-10]MDV6376279.1 hypothetical protein [Deinococcus sp. ZS9-10]
MCAAPRSSSQITVPWAEWEQSIRALLEVGKGQAALRTIGQALENGQPATDLLELLNLADVLGGPLEAGALRLRLRLLSNASGAQEIERVARPLLDVTGPGLGGAAFLHPYLAWALSQREAYGQALVHAEYALQDEGQLTPRERSLAWRMKGLALNRLNPDHLDPDPVNLHSAWDAAFQQALQGIQGWGRALILVDLGGLHSRRGDEGRAMRAFSEALPLVPPGRPELRAQTLNNMGMICLRAGQLDEAEGYFGQEARVRGASRSRALCGQGAVRRTRGEWDRAAALYRQAARLAAKTGDADDLRQARRGLGHTQRLAGQPMTALDTLQGAALTTAADRESGQSWVNVDVAAALVTLPALDPPQVRAALTHTGPLDREETERAAVVQAELTRRENKPQEACAAVARLDRTSLWIREEAHAFAELFGLLPANLRPEPLPRPGRTAVALRVLGLPEVRVNGRRVSLPPLEMTLLAALHDAGGELSTDGLIEVLRDSRPRTPRAAAQRVSKTVRQLRVALGWEASVQNAPGRYWLDPLTVWTSDLQDARRRGVPVESFLAGVSLPWATEREQELRQIDSDF